MNMSEAIINTAKIGRQVVLQQVQAIPEERFDIQKLQDLTTPSVGMSAISFIGWIRILP